jgi:hypothetical protein
VRRTHRGGAGVGWPTSSSANGLCESRDGFLVARAIA